ncbi:hypothetical protein RBH26_20815 [Natronolimnohabitans sp. A-GB9]|uniref:hypothetical protein n=1 Tax=Natronolimnohabitans sp. A-GB9 TaxID=3069757 RepID=UPI0027B2FA7C|nr:hypothetical protein [Natronolimnohabitans sp. A-GB9]MDQ2052887.1 hypothetical protein [Natronolimnohabitans sp. A-GB9]
MTETEKPELFQVLQAAQDGGLVGEEETALTVFTAMIRGGMVIMNGPSRVGKTFTVTRMSRAIPDSDVYEMSTTMSPTALYYAADEINACRVHIYQDLASLPDHIEGVLKANAEGLPASREVTDITSGDTVRMTINPPDCIIVGIASDNEKIDLNDYPELRNRGLIVSCDASQEQTERILDSQADTLSGLKKMHLTPEQLAGIHEYVKDIPISRYARDDSLGTILNIPGGRPLREQDPVPTHFTEARDDYMRLNDFIESVTLFHYADRMEILHDGQPALLVTPADVWHGMRIFGNQMIMSALNLKEIDKVILEFLREEKSAFTVSKIQAKIRADGYNVTDRDVHGALKSMKGKAYVDVNQADNPQTWYATGFASVVDHPAAVDYQALVGQTEKIAREVLPAGEAEEYIYRFCRGEGLIVTDPINGEQVNIVEDTSFAEQLEEAEEELDDVLNTPLWGTDESEKADDEEEREENEIELSGDRPRSADVTEATAFETVEGSESGQGTLL